MTLVVHTLLEAHGTEDCMAWKLDYRTQGDLLGEISVGHEHYYFPPTWLEGDDARRRGCRLFEPEPGGFWVVEMGHEDLQRVCDAGAVLEPAGGEGPQARLAGTTVEGLDRDRRYALVWLEVY